MLEPDASVLRRRIVGIISCHGRILTPKRLAKSLFRGTRGYEREVFGSRRRKICIIKLQWVLQRGLLRSMEGWKSEVSDNSNKVGLERHFGRSLGFSEDFKTYHYRSELVRYRTDGIYYLRKASSEICL